jgi:hypothetical protein
MTEKYTSFNRPREAVFLAMHGHFYVFKGTAGEIYHLTGYQLSTDVRKAIDDFSWGEVHVTLTFRSDASSGGWFAT